MSQALLSDVEISIGDAMNLAVRDGALVVTPLRRVRGGHDLSELVKRIPMVEQVKSIDFRSRNVKRIGSAPAPVLQEVLSILDACLY